MEVLVANHSGYPHTGPEIDAAEESAEGAAAAAALEQESAGVDVVTDGRSPWSDPVAHVLAGVSGVLLEECRAYEGGGPVYRQPRIVAPLRHAPRPTSPARTGSGKGWKAVIPGPYTLARLSVVDGAPYDDVPALAHALSELLVHEVRRLAAQAAYVQVEEPAILRHPRDIRLLRTLLEPLWQARGAAQIVLATYGEGAEPLYAQLNSLPADVLAVDVVSDPGLADVIAATGSGKALAIGLVDGRRDADASAEELADRVRRMLSRYVLEAVYLQPSCGLEGLSPAGARRKCELLAATRDILLGKTGRRR